MQGTVKWFDSKKGFGFIEPDGNGKRDKDIFVHYTGIQGDGYRQLSEGDRVEFDVTEGRKGKQAENVKVI